MDQVLRSELAHNAEHALYLVAGYLYFLPIVGSEPVPWRISAPARYLMLLVGMQVDTAVGIALVIQGHEVFGAYAGARRAWGPSLLADLHLGGMVMWIGSDIVMTILALAVCVAIVHDPRRAGRLGAWIEDRRRAAVLRQVSAAGLSVSGSRHRGRTVDDEAHLTAYNAYLRMLSDRGAAGRPGQGPPG